MYYHTDALGSVTMTTDQNGDVLNEYRYKPFGTVKTKTGTAPDPKFLWVGSLGYRQTGRIYSDAYVRARHYGYLQGAWTSVDPLWPREGAFVYVSWEIVSASDPTGLGNYDTSGLTCFCTEQYAAMQVSGISPLDGRYKCAMAACNGYCKAVGIAASFQLPCIGDVFAIPSCLFINNSLPDCAKSNPYYGFCCQHGGADGLPYTANLGCCVECCIRTCCWRVGPYLGVASLKYTLSMRNCGITGRVFAPSWSQPCN
jgi:hypothetical protein